jgi:hypothetical protein
MEAAEERLFFLVCLRFGDSVLKAAFTTLFLVPLTGEATETCPSDLAAGEKAIRGSNSGRIECAFDVQTCRSLQA